VLRAAPGYAGVMWRALVIVLVACKFPHGAPVVGDSGEIDMPNGDDAAADAVPGMDMQMPADSAMLGPWSAPTLVRMPSSAEDDPTLTSDMLEMYFNRSNDIYMMTRSSIGAAWSTPVLVTELSSSTAADTTPEITGDGLMIFLASLRTGTEGNNDIWFSTRNSRNDPWSAPVRVPELSTSDDDNCPAITDDGLAIVWNTPANPEQLYTSTRASKTSTWGAPVELTSLNTTARELAGMMSQDRLTIYFDSSRAGTEDLWVATRASPTQPFQAPTPITELNTSSSDFDPWVSADGRHMFFASNRDGTTAIYETSR